MVSNPIQPLIRKWGQILRPPPASQESFPPLEPKPASNSLDHPFGGKARTFMPSADTATCPGKTNLNKCRYSQKGKGRTRTCVRLNRAQG